MLLWNRDCGVFAVYRCYCFRVCAHVRRRTRFAVFVSRFSLVRAASVFVLGYEFVVVFVRLLVFILGRDRDFLMSEAVSTLTNQNTIFCSVHCFGTRPHSKTSNRHYRSGTLVQGRSQAGPEVSLDSPSVACWAYL